MRFPNCHTYNIIIDCIQCQVYCHTIIPLQGQEANATLFKSLSRIIKRADASFVKDRENTGNSFTISRYGDSMMKTFRFKKIDAFATQKSGGNPAGMVSLNSFEEITADEMQRIAWELKGFVSEVGYVRQIDETFFELKYYASEREVDFCGHATIAIMYDLIKNSETLINQKQLTIKTPKGKLIVENKVLTENAVFISAPAPVFPPGKINANIIAKALKIASDEIHPDYPISLVNAGLETLIVPINSLGNILSITPDIYELKAFCVENAVHIITVFTNDTMDEKHEFRTRVFAPAFGYLEDPATGSGNAALGGYLLKNHSWDGTLISIEQNASPENPNIIKLMAKNPGGDDPRVMFGGGAITRIEGEYFLQG
ncbi:MAG: PhzF family phenazine biosynthesis protein [Pseudomonadota bacterium]